MGGAWRASRDSEWGMAFRGSVDGDLMNDDAQWKGSLSKPKHTEPNKGDFIWMDDLDFILFGRITNQSKSKKSE